MSERGNRPGGRSRTGWSVFGIVFGSCLVVSGLVIVGAFVLFAVGMNNTGSGK